MISQARNEWRRCRQRTRNFVHRAGGLDENIAGIYVSAHGFLALVHGYRAATYRNQAFDLGIRPYEPRLLKCED